MSSIPTTTSGYCPTAYGTSPECVNSFWTTVTSSCRALSRTKSSSTTASHRSCYSPRLWTFCYSESRTEPITPTAQRKLTATRSHAMFQLSSHYFVGARPSSLTGVAQSRNSPTRSNAWSQRPDVPLCTAPAAADSGTDDEGETGRLSLSSWRPIRCKTSPSAHAPVARAGSTVSSTPRSWRTRRRPSAPRRRRAAPGHATH